MIEISRLTQESFGLKPIRQLFKRLFCIMKLKLFRIGDSKKFVNIMYQ